MGCRRYWRSGWVWEYSGGGARGWVSKGYTGGKGPGGSRYRGNGGPGVGG